MSATLRSTAGLVAAEDAHTSGLYTKRGIVLVRGEGAVVYDSEGRAYIDCVGGQGIANLGHGNAAVANAIAEPASSRTSRRRQATTSSPGSSRRRSTASFSATAGPRRSREL